MTLKQYFKAILFGIVLLILFGIFFFPISEHELIQNQTEILEEKIGVPIIIRQVEPINGSIFYLVSTENGERFILHAEKFIFFKRYRILNPLTTKIDQFETSNLLNDISVKLNHSVMTISTKMTIIKHTWPIILIYMILPLIGRLQQFNKKGKSKYKM